jgi:PhzF family phenazine biosynthesis protein
MKIPIYQVDAFAGRLFAGNPAAVCPLERWLDEGVMQSIAAENNLSETAFLVREDGARRIRWFTPGVEVDLCGHATLASAAVICELLEPGVERVDFLSKSGPLAVSKRGDRYELDFPALPPAPALPPDGLIEALGRRPAEVLAAKDWLCVFEREADVRALVPDMARLASVHECRGVVCSAPGERGDFVSRCFFPKQGVPEDPATGSAHCMLTPYWAKRLGKRELHALQLSARGGELFCEDRGERVGIAGRAVLYLEGAIHV